MKAFITVPQGAAGSDFFDCRTVQYLENVCETVYNPYNRQMTVDEAAEMVGDCDVYVTGWGSPCLEKRILDKAPNIRLLTHVGGSVFGYTSPEMWDRGIRVISGNALMAESGAEGTLAYILAAYRDIPSFSASFLISSFVSST